MERTGRIFKFLKEHELDCIAIKDACTIRYLTGFTGDSSVLYADDRKVILITDGRYTEQARSQVKYCRVLEYKANHNNSIWEAVAEQIGDRHKAGFDGDRFSYEEARILKELLPAEVEMISVSLGSLRMVKDDRELKSLWKAFKIADSAFEMLLKELAPGMTEKELAARLEYYMRSQGSEGTSFDTIVASGYRSALPHARLQIKQSRSAILLRLILARCMTDTIRIRPVRSLWGWLIPGTEKSILWWKRPIIGGSRMPNRVLPAKSWIR